MNLGGTEKSLLSLLSILDQSKFDVRLLLLEDGGLLRDQIPSWIKVDIYDDFSNYKAIIYDHPISTFKKQILSFHLISAWFTLMRYIIIKLTGNWFYNYSFVLKNKSSLYEVDYAIAYAGPDNFISYFIANHIKARRKIQWIHFDVSKVLSDSKFGNKFYPLFDKIICVSDNAKIEFIKMFPTISNKTEVLENIVSQEELFKKSKVGLTFNDNYNGIRIVTLGRLSKEKGQHMIPEVVKKLKTDGFVFRWYLIGDGNLREELENEIKNNHIERELILLGSQINPYAFLRDSDIYVQTSLHEGYCITLKEAKIFNLPVVTTNFLSASNLIKDEEDGLIVEISINGLYIGVKRLLEDNQLKSKLSCYNYNIKCYDESLFS